MHIILGALTLIVTILVLVKRLSDAGVDIGWLNPFTWARRRAWRKQYQSHSAFTLDGPLEVAALLATTVAKMDGDINSEEQKTLLSLFQNEFGKSENEASDLLRSSLYIFGDGKDAIAKPEKVLTRSLEKFSEEQAKSVLEVLSLVKNSGAANAAEKEKFIQRVEKVFSDKFNTAGRW